MSGQAKLMTAGGGGVILNPASSIASDVTVNIPSANCTVLTTTSSGQSIPTAALPAGTVLQVVNATTNVDTFTTSGSFVDTGLTATITPTSSTSKIIVMAVIPFFKEPGNVASGVKANIVRNGSALLTWINYGGWNNVDGRARMPYSCNYQDSPATTSAVTYKIQACCADGSAGNRISWCHDNSTAFITLMEIAA